MIFSLVISAVFVAAASASESAADKASRLYYQGEHAKAVEHYARAIAQSSQTVTPWINGAVVLDELGETRKALRWYRKAAELSADPEIHNALGWAELRFGTLSAAQDAWKTVLQRRPDHPHALLGMARAQLKLSRPSQALVFLEHARASAPLLNLVPYFQALAYSETGNRQKEIESYRQAVSADFLFHESRQALGRTFIRLRRFQDAWRQLSFLLGYEPNNKRLANLLAQIKPLLSGSPAPLYPSSGSALPAEGPAEMISKHSQAPVIRVGLWASPMGKPQARTAAAFTVNGPFSIVDSKSGKVWGRGEAFQSWHVRVLLVKKRLMLEMTAAGSQSPLRSRSALILRPDSPERGVIFIDSAPHPTPVAWRTSTGKHLRGELEIAPYPPKNSLKITNQLDLESYTHGVVAMEMPSRSPLEALKAQAVIARSHALFVKQVSRRHRKEGFDVCDQQHCQVYNGVRAEEPRSRAVVLGTEGRIVTYKGKVAHVIYSSNCGGNTQSGREVTGWGDVPYWSGIRDSAGGGTPNSPWELRLSLEGLPAAYCRPSHYVHAANYRWTRVVGFKDLETKLDRIYRTGKLLAVRAGRRAQSGNVNNLWIFGSRRKVKVTSESAIRGVLSLGSLRSTLFVFETEYDARGNPERLVFYGGGWGHGLGLCQSGAMGRAEAGESYEQIIKGYFHDTQLANLRYGK